FSSFQRQERGGSEKSRPKKIVPVVKLGIRQVVRRYAMHSLLQRTQILRLRNIVAFALDPLRDDNRAMNSKNFREDVLQARVYRKLANELCVFRRRGLVDLHGPPAHRAFQHETAALVERISVVNRLDRSQLRASKDHGLSASLGK